MKRSIIIDNGVAILQFFFKNDTLEELAKEYQNTSSEKRKWMIDTHKDREFKMLRELYSIEILSRVPSSTFILTEADLEEIKKVSDEVRSLGETTETLDGYLFS